MRKHLDYAEMSDSERFAVLTKVLTSTNMQNTQSLFQGITEIANALESRLDQLQKDVENLSIKINRVLTDKFQYEIENALENVANDTD